MARRRKGNKKLVVVAISLLLVMITLGMGIMASRFVQNKGDNPNQEPDQPAFSQSTPPAIGDDMPNHSGGEEDMGDPNGGLEEIPIDSPKSFPEEMRAVYISPGSDYDPKADEATIRSALDGKLSSAKDLTMNTIVVDLSYGNGVLQRSSLLPSLQPAFDSISYLIAQGKAEGFYVYVYYPVMSVIQDQPSETGLPDYTVINRVRQDIADFCMKYQPNGVLLDGYYAVVGNDGYGDYLKQGGAVGYQTYLEEISQLIYKTAVDSFRANAPWLHIGMVTEPVWENSSADERGSNTKASFTTLGDGHFDSLQILLEEGYGDFMMIKTPGSMDDPKVPYKTIMNWWDKQMADSGIPVYCLHYSSKAATDAIGWSEYDQLARQIIAGRETEIYHGGIFDSLGRLEENPKNVASTIVKYYEGEMDPKHIMTDLAVIKPEKQTYTTFEPTVTFSGASDPNTSVTINKQEVKTDQNGYFTTSLPLSAGLNTFDFYHKGRTVKYNITRHVKVVQAVSPQGNITLDGGMKLTIAATAYSEANVTAKINGVTIKMQRSDTEDDQVDKDSAYRTFYGYYTVPPSTNTVQSLGKITVSGSWGEFSDSEYGGNVSVNKTIPVSSGKAVRITADQAATLSPNDLDPYGTPDYYPLPSGATDYTVGTEMFYQTSSKTYAFYRLRSGVRVNTADLAALTADGPGGNVIKGVTVTADKRYTKVIINTQQQVTYQASYDGNSFKVEFNYTTKTPSSMKLSKNPLFTAANWSGTTLTLPLVKKNCFMGVYSYFDTSGNLVLRFNNPPSGVSGSEIVIDPGHGGNDTGALGFLQSYHEREINQMLAKKITAELRARGANVTMLETANNNLSLPERTAAARDANPQLFLSVHCNSINYSTAYGTEAYYFYPFSQYLASQLSKNTANAIDTNNRGGKFGNFYVIRTPQYASALIETAFVSNEYDYHQLLDGNIQSRVATGVSNAVESYFVSMNTGRLGAVGTETTGTPPQEITMPGEEENNAEEPSDGEIEDLTLFPEEDVSLSVDAMTTIEAILASDETSVEVNWSYEESDNGIAEIEFDGNLANIWAIDVGTVKITASVPGTNLSKTITITIE